MAWKFLNILGGSVVVLALLLNVVPNAAGAGMLQRWQRGLFLVLAVLGFMFSFYATLKWGENYPQVLAHMGCPYLSRFDDDLAVCKPAAAANNGAGPRDAEGETSRGRGTASTFSRKVPIFVVGAGGENDSRVRDALRLRLSNAGFNIVDQSGEALVTVRVSVDQLGNVDRGTSTPRVELTSSVKVRVSATWTASKAPLIAPAIVEGHGKVLAGQGNARIAALSDAVDVIVLQLEKLAKE